MRPRVAAVTPRCLLSISPIRCDYTRRAHKVFMPVIRVYSDFSCHFPVARENNIDRKSLFRCHFPVVNCAQDTHNIVISGTHTNEGISHIPHLSWLLLGKPPSSLEGCLIKRFSHEWHVNNAEPEMCTTFHLSLVPYRL